MIGMMRLYKNVFLSRSSAMEGINFGSPAEVPELQVPWHQLLISSQKKKNLLYEDNPQKKKEEENRIKEREKPG